MQINALHRSTDLRPLPYICVSFLQVLLAITYLSCGVWAQHYPETAQIPHFDTLHGEILPDPYHWLRDRESDLVQEHLLRENKYTLKKTRHSKGLQKHLYNEFISRILETDLTVPYYERGYWYYERYEAGMDYEILCRKKESLDAPEEVMLDVNQMAALYDYYSLEDFLVSPSNQFLGFLVDLQGSNQTELFFKDITTDVVLPYSVPQTAMMAWLGDFVVVYCKMDSLNRSYQVWRHNIGEDPKADQLLYEEKDPAFSVNLYANKSEEYIFLETTSSTSNEVHYLHVDSLDSPFQLFRAREPNHLYYLDYFKDHFFIFSNLDAINFKVLKTPVGQTEGQNWKEIIPHREEVLLEEFELFEDYFVILEKNRGVPELRIQPWGEEPYYIQFEDANYTLYLEENPDFKSHALRFSYESFTVPYTVYTYDMKERTRTIIKQDSIPDAYNPDLYHSERVFVPARDGAEIPVTLVYRKDLKRPEGNPLLQEAYGAYGVGFDIYFNPGIPSLLDRGVVYAVAHVRGGNELGRQWYEAGRMLNKRNSFYDFIDCSEYLIDKKYTQKKDIIAYGASAGGLIMGVVANECPELYRAIVLDVPFVDLINTMSDPTLPLTTSEYEEWGNPGKPEHFRYMRTYSPYENVKAQDYPPMLFISSRFDFNVGFWEPTKLVARLRDKKTDENPILLAVDMYAGHSGASGRYDQWKELAFLYAYVLNTFGIRK